MLYKIVNGSITLGNNTILEEINFSIKNKEHVAIVGRNGCGKTTLLRSIIGELELDKGISEEEFSVTSLGIKRIGYIRQDAIISNNITMIEEILKAYEDILLVEKRLEKLEKELSVKYDEKLLNKYQDLYLYYQNIGGYQYKKEYELAILMFGFTEEDKNKKLKDFSYGERTKIAILRLVLSKPDLLILDEPTNHLDVRAIEWLEEYLVNYPKMLIVVSHDRMFLDRVCSITYEIEYGSLVKYTGNYSYYEKQKKILYEKNLRNYEYQQKEIDRLTKIADRFRYKPSKASMALSKLKQIERMVKIDKPKGADKRTFMNHFNPAVESYRDVLKVKDLVIGYDKALGKISFTLERGERLGIIGENGTGKSTFLKTILGIIPKLQGKYVFGNRVQIGYFDQNVESLSCDKVILDIMKDDFPDIEEVELRNNLGAFGFSGDTVFRTVGSLSGGQKVKLLLCKIMRHQPNVLILDEPTNHLDIIGKETIEEMLLRYRGTIIFVSHDRYFIKKIATSLLAFEHGEINYYQDNYDSYLEKKMNSKEIVVDEVSNLSKKNVNKQKYVSDLKEKSKLEREVKKIESEVQKLENKINEYQQEMLKEEVYMDIKRVREVEEQLKDVEKILNEKMAIWEKIMLKLEI